MYALVDIGGTKTRVALSADLLTFGEVKVFSTPSDFHEGVSEVVRVITELRGDTPLKAAAIGVAASPNAEKTELVSGGTNIKGWLRQPIKEQFENALGCKVFIENDAAMGGLAQVTYGPAQGRRIAAYITVSTGVGGCRFVDGRIDESATGFEPSWLIVDASKLNDTQNICGGGYLASYVSGACTEEHEGRKPVEITDEAFWKEKAKWLAYGLHDICMLWSPEVIVLGGSMMNKIGIPIPEVRLCLEDTIRGSIPVAPEIVPAVFGDEMGVHGAMAYLRQKGL